MTIPGWTRPASLAVTLAASSLLALAAPTRAAAEGAKCFSDERYVSQGTADGLEISVRRFCFGYGTDDQFATCPRVVNASGRRRKVKIQWVARCEDGTEFRTPKGSIWFSYDLAPGAKEDLGDGYFENADCFFPCPAHVVPVRVGWVIDDEGAAAEQQAVEAGVIGEAARRAEEARRAEAERTAEAERVQAQKRQVLDERRQRAERRAGELAAANEARQREAAEAERRRVAAVNQRIEAQRSVQQATLDAGERYRNEMASKLSDIDVGSGFRKGSFLIGASFPALLGAADVTAFGMGLQIGFTRTGWRRCGEDHCTGSELAFRTSLAFGQEMDIVTGDATTLTQYRADAELGWWFGPIGLFAHADAAQTSGLPESVGTVRAGPGVALTFSHRKDSAGSLAVFWTPLLDGSAAAGTARFQVGIGAFMISAEATQTPAIGDRPAQWMVLFPIGGNVPW